MRFDSAVKMKMEIYSAVRMHVSRNSAVSLGMGLDCGVRKVLKLNHVIKI